MHTRGARPSLRGLFGVAGLALAGLVSLAAQRPADATILNASASAPQHHVDASAAVTTGMIAQAATPPQPSDGGTAAANARQIFNRACGRCHPGGEEDVGPRLTNINWTEARMTGQIRNGGGRMRAVPAARLTDADLATMMAYLRQIHAVH